MLIDRAQIYVRTDDGENGSSPQTKRSGQTKGDSARDTARLLDQSLSLEEAAKATRQALGTGRVAVQQQQATSQPQKQVNPSFAKQSSARQSKPAQPSKLEKEIADLIMD